ncbi:MAG: alpha/beta hydrolase [Rhabdochlamydiaceae bacterium]|jgi:pimeloyl-ACP methyl ester carboxylesterase
MEAIGIKNTVQTSEGTISVWDSQGEGIPVVCLHSNSACKEAFHQQFSALGHTFRFIAVDLPGHGMSENAKNPSIYSIPGYAQIIFEVIDAMKINRVVVLGWSLGGHIGIEMDQQQPTRLIGLCITGTPPIPFSQEGFNAGFRPIPVIQNLLGKEVFTIREAQEFNRCGGIDLTTDHYLLDATLRTHGLARSHMLASLIRGEGNNQKQAVEKSTTPLLIIAGEKDEGVNNDYLTQEVCYKNLWSGRVHIIDGAGHATLLARADAFNGILSQFLAEVSTPAKD